MNEEEWGREGEMLLLAGAAHVPGDTGEHFPGHPCDCT